MKKKRSRILALLMALVMVLTFGLVACKPNEEPPTPPPYVPETPTPTPAEESGLFGNALEDLGVADPGWVEDEDAGTLFADGGNKRSYYRVTPAMEYVFSADITFGAKKADEWPKGGIVAAQGKMYSENAMVNYPANGNDLSVYGGSGTNVDMSQKDSYPFEGDSDTVNLEIVRRGGNFYYYVNGAFLGYKYNAYFDANAACPGFQMWGGQVTYTNVRYSTDAAEITSKIQTASASFEIIEVEGGSVEVVSEFGGTVAIGTPAYVKFNPDDGYRLSGLKINARAELYNVTLEGNQPTYRIANTAAANVVEPEFEAIPTTTYTVSGKVGYEGDVAPNQILAYAYSGSYVKELELVYNAADGDYDYTVELPEGENYCFSVVSNGFVSAFAKSDVFASTELDFMLKEIPFGATEDMGIEGTWSTDALSRGEVTNAGGWSRLPITEISGQDKFFLSADVHVLNPLDTQARVGLLFGHPTTELDNNGNPKNDEIQPTVKFDAGRYIINILGRNAAITQLTEEQTAKLLDASVGLNLALYRDGSLVKIYVDGVLYTEFNDADENADWTAGLAAWTKAQYSDLKWATGDEADELMMSQSTLKITERSNNGTSTAVTAPVVGSTYKATFVADDGYYVSEIYINGVDRFKDYGGKATATVEEIATVNNYDIQVAYDKASTEVYTFSGSVSLHKKGETLVGAGATVTVYGDTISTVTADAEGNFTVELTDRKYAVEISYDGYVTDELVLDINKDTEYNATLEYSIFRVHQGGAELDEQNENSVTLANGYSYAYFNEIAADEKYFVAYATAFYGDANPNDYRVGIAFNRHYEKTANAAYEASFTIHNDKFSKIIAGAFNQGEIALDEAKLAKFKGESGIQLMLIRYNTTVFMVIDGELYYTATVSADTPSNVGIVSWYESTFVDYGVITGKTALDEYAAISFDGENDLGSWEGSGIFGGHGQIEFTPDDGYEIASVIINGEDLTARVINRRLDLETVKFLDYEIEVTFREIAAVTETASLDGTVKIHRNGGIFDTAATVTLSTPNSSVEATSNGGFLFEDIPATFYNIKVEKAGYETYYGEVDLSDGDVTLSDAIVLEYNGFATVSGINADAINDGTVITGGGYSISKLALPGKNFYLEGTVKFNAAPNGNSRLGFALNKNDDAEGVTSFRPSVRIDGNGTDVTKVYLQVMGQFNKDVPVADNGKAFTGIKVALARFNNVIYVYFDGELCYTSAIADSVPSEIAIEQWAAGQITDLRLYNDGELYGFAKKTVSGTVAIGNGASVAGATVSVYGCDGTQLNSAELGADGAFSLQLDSVGKAFVTVEKEGYATIRRFIDVTDGTLSFTLNTYEYTSLFNMSVSDGGETVTSTPTGLHCPEAKMDNFPATENFLLTTVIKQDLTANNYGENYSGLGIDIRTSEGKHYEFLYRRVNSDTEFNLRGYSDSNGNYYNLTADEIAALTAGNGLKMRVIRGNGEIKVFVGEKDEASLTIAIGAAEITSFKFKSWTGTGTYNDITLITGDAAFSVDCSAGGTATVENKTVGGIATLTLAPNANYYVTSVKVNGEERIDELADNKLNFVVSKPAYDIDVTYVYEDPTTYTVEGTVKSNKLGEADAVLSGAKVTLVSKDGKISEEATTGADGKFEFTVKTREYTLTVEKAGYHTYTATVALTENKVNDVTLEWNTATVKAGNWDISGINDGSVTFLGNSSDSTWGYVRLNDIAENEKYFVASAVFKHVGYRMGISVNREDQDVSEYAGTLNEAGDYSSAGQAGWGPIAPISEANKAASKGDGLRITVVRSNTKIYYFAGNDLIKSWTVDDSVLSRVSIVNWTQQTNVVTGITVACGEAAVNEFISSRPTYAYAGTVSYVTDYKGSRVNASGATVKLTSLGGAEYNATAASDGSFSISGVMGGYYTVTVSYDGKTFTDLMLVEGNNSAVALAVSDLNLSESESGIVRSDGNRTVAYTVGQGNFLTQLNDVPADGNFAVSAVIYVKPAVYGDNWNGLGFDIATTAGKHYELLYRKNNNTTNDFSAYNVQGYSDSGVNAGSLTVDQVARLTNPAKGVELKLVRIGDKLNLYVDGGETPVYTVNMTAGDTITRFAFKSWNAAGAYKNVYVLKGDAAVTGNAAVTGGTWQASNLAVGGTATIDIDAAVGYHLKSLTVNGVDVTANVANGAYSFTVLRPDYEVAAEFELDVRYTYAGTVKGYNLDGELVAVEGATVTLTGANGTVSKTTGADGKFEFTTADDLLSGSYTVSVESANHLSASKTIELNANVSGEELTLQSDFISSLGSGVARSTDGNSVVITGGNNVETYINAKYIPAGDFGLSANMYWTGNTGDNWASLGFAIHTDGASANKFEVLFRYPNNSALTLHSYTGLNRELAKLTAEQIAKYKDVNVGLEMRIIKLGNVVSIYFDGSDAPIATYTMSGKVTKIDLHTWTANGEIRQIKFFETVSVTGAQAANGTWTSNASLGASSTITVAPNADYRLKSLTVNGVDVTAGVVANVYTFNAGLPTYTVAAEFEEIPEKYWAYAGTVKGYAVDGSVINLAGATVTLASTDNTYTATTASDGTFTIENILEGAYTLTVTKKDNGTYTESVSLTADVSDKVITVNGIDYTNATATAVPSNGGRTVTVTPVERNCPEATVVTVPSSGNFMVTTVIKQDLTANNYGESYSGLGMDVVTSSGAHYEWLYRRVNSDTAFDLRGYSSCNGTFYTLTAAEITALTGGDGLMLKVIRSGNELKIYVGDSDTPKKTIDMGDVTISTFKLKSWTGTGTYNNVRVYTGNAAISGEKTVANGSWSAPESVQIGSIATVNLTPDSGYRVKSVKVNGVEKLAEVADNKLSFLACKLDYTVVAEFEEIPVTWSYAGSVSGHRHAEVFALEGATVKLANEYDTYTATAGADGSFSLDSVLQGEYTVTVSKSGYVTKTSTLNLTANESGVATTLEFDLVNGISGFNVANQNDGTVTFSGGYGLPAIKAIPAASRYWVVDTVVKSTATGSGSRFGGIAVNKNDDNDGETSARFNLYNEGGTKLRVDMQSVTNVALSAEQLAAATGGDSAAGVRLTVARVVDVLYVYVDGALKYTRFIPANAPSNVSFESWVACSYTQLRVYTDGDAANYLSTLTTVSGTISEKTSGSVEGTVVTVKKMDGSVIATKTLGAGETTYSFDNIPTGNFVRITAEKSGYLVEGRILKLSAATTVDLTITAVRFTKTGSTYTVTDGGKTVSYNSTVQNNDKYYIENKSDNWTLTTYVTFDRTKCWSTESNGGTEGYPGMGFLITGDRGGEDKIESCIRLTVASGAYNFCAYNGLNGGTVGITGDNLTALLSETGLKITVKCVNGIVSFYAGDSTTAYHTAGTAIVRNTTIAIMNWCGGGTFRNITLTHN